MKMNIFVKIDLQSDLEIQWDFRLRRRGRRLKEKRKLTLSKVGLKKSVTTYFANIVDSIKNSFQRWSHIIWDLCDFHFSSYPISIIYPLFMQANSYLCQMS